MGQLHTFIRKFRGSALFWRDDVPTWTCGQMIVSGDTSLERYFGEVGLDILHMHLDKEGNRSRDSRILGFYPLESVPWNLHVSKVTPTFKPPYEHEITTDAISDLLKREPEIPYSFNQEKRFVYPSSNNLAAYVLQKNSSDNSRAPEEVLVREYWVDYLLSLYPGLEGIDIKCSDGVISFKGSDGFEAIYMAMRPNT